MTSLDEKSSWDFWKNSPDLVDPFIVTEWNAQDLEDHWKSYPGCHVLFTAQMHDLLPRFLKIFPNAEEKVFVPEEGTKEYVDVILGRVSKVQGLPLEKIFPRKISAKKLKKFLIINELHPLGGLVPALSIIQELRKLGVGWDIFEHQVPVREIFIPDRNWEIHHFPPSAADITFSWRKALEVKEAPPEMDLEDSIVFFCPLHFTPPASSALWRCAEAGARIVTVRSPFTRALQGEGVLSYSPKLFEDFDPFQKPPGSHVNQALTEVIAREIHSWIN